MVLLSGEVETALAYGRKVDEQAGFRMVLLSGEVETTIYIEAVEGLVHREVLAAFRFTTSEAIEHLPWKPISPTRPYPATSPPWGC